MARLVSVLVALAVGAAAGLFCLHHYLRMAGT